MKSWLLCILFIVSPDPVKINKINKTKAEAKKAYEAGDYKTAVAKYRYLIDSLGVHEDEAKLNLANAYFNLQDSATTDAYQQLTQSSNSEVRSKAEQQLGVLKNKAGQPEEALQHFKNALKTNPNNQDARYNYEMLKKKLEEEKKKQQQQQNQDQKKDQQDNQDQQNKDKKEQEKKDQQKEQEKKDQEKKDQQQKDQQNKDKKDQQQKEQEKKDQQQQQKEKQEQEQKDAKDEQEKKDQQPTPSEKLKQMNMSEEKAKMILEAMKNQEVQYLQQNKRKATKPRDKSKPDW